MHDIWNPWHGCRRCSEGCQNCYMFYLDDRHGKDGGDIRKNANAFRYPLSKDRAGNYKVNYHTYAVPEGHPVDGGF